MNTKKDIEKEIKVPYFTKTGEKLKVPYFTIREGWGTGWSTKIESLADQIISLATMMVVFSPKKGN